MKIIESEKSSDEKVIKVFNYEIYKKKLKYRKQFIFNKFIQIIKKVNAGKSLIFKLIKVCGLEVLKVFMNGQNRIIYLFKIPVFKQSLFKYYKNWFTKGVDKKYDDIYVLTVHSGEIFVFLTYFAKAFINKNKSKNPLFIVTRNYHKDLVKMIYPEIPYICRDGFPVYIKDNSFKIGNQRFFLLYNWDFYGITKKCISDNLNYLKVMQRNLNLNDNEIALKKIIIPNSDEKNMLEKISKTGLNIDKFIFIAPEATACNLIENEFWLRLISYFKSRKYDIYLNLNDQKMDFKELSPDGFCKSVPLNIIEAFALAKKAKKIISLRSGFSEILFQTGTDMDVIYTEKLYYDYAQISKHMMIFDCGQINDYLVNKQTIKQDLDFIYEEITKSII